jgi:sugar-specific transcriptional regulator TrmB
MSNLQLVYNAIVKDRNIGDEFTFKDIKKEVHLKDQQIYNAIASLKNKGIIESLRISVGGNPQLYRLIKLTDQHFQKRKTVLDKAIDTRDSIKKLEDLNEMDYETAGKIWITAFKKLEEQVRILKNKLEDQKQSYIKINTDLRNEISCLNKKLKAAEEICKNVRGRTMIEPTGFKFQDVVRIAKEDKLS